MSIVAIGDSIVNAGESWAYWLSRAIGEPLTRHSVGGATSSDVLDQLHHLSGHSYELGCITVGTNDVLLDWSPEVFEDNLVTIMGTISQRAERVVMPTLSLGLAYFPGSGSEIRRRVEQANALIRTSGAVVIEAGDLRGPQTMSPDRVHPSLRGQLLIADRAAELLDITPVPSSLHDGVFPRPAWSVRAKMTSEQTLKRLVKRSLGRAF